MKEANSPDSIKLLNENIGDLYRFIIDNSPYTIVIIDIHGSIIYANQAFTDNTGYSMGEVVNQNSFDLIHPDDKQYVLTKYESALAGQKVENIEYRYKIKDGYYLHLLTDAVPIINSDNEVLAIITMTQDITERIKDKKRLKESEARKSAMIEAIPDLIFIMKEDGKILDFNAPDVDELYIPPDDIIGSNIHDIMPQEIVDPLMNIISNVIHIKEPSVLEYQLKLPKGLQDYEARFALSGKKEVLAIVRNITEKKKMEEERSRMLQIETIGLLAGGIAHDFNNILVGILGNINLMQMERDFSESLRKSLNEMENATLRASELTNQLLTFSKGGEPITKPESIKDIVESSISFVMRGSRSKCFTQYQTDLPTVDVEAGQIYQVINNIVINADQSMSEGGLILIAVDLENITLNNNLPLENGKFVVITIQDQGTGIPEEIKERIFEPYFTTKPTGSGLGLTTSYSIIKRHNGHISVESQEQVGSSFKIYLPISKDEPITEVHRLDKKIKLQGKILIMDDDHTIQITLSRMLNQLGLTTVITTDGYSCIEKYKIALDNEPFSLIIMDLTVSGGMGGKEAISKIQQIDPCVKAIVSSGYSNDPIMANYEDYGFQDVLLKPYTITQLRNTLVEVLNK